MVEDLKVLSIDGTLDTYQERHVEVTERSLVSDHGTQQISNTLAEEPVKWDISTEQSLTR